MPDPVAASSRGGDMKFSLARLRFLVAGLAATILLVGAAPASAVFSVSSVTATPSTTQAGGHPDLSITTNFSGDNTQIGGPGATNPVADSPSIYEVHLGPGLFGNPLAAPTCPLADFQADTCSSDTRVGSASQGIFILFAPPGSQTATLSPTDLGLDAINLEPLTAVSATAGPIRITSLGLTLDGSVLNGFYMSN